jgi:hypothetical protein
MVWSSSLGIWIPTEPLEHLIRTDRGGVLFRVFRYGDDRYARVMEPEPSK